MKKSCRLPVCRQYALTVLDKSVVVTVLRHLHSCPVGKHFDRLNIVEVFNSAHKGYCVAARSAAEAVKRLTFGIYGKGRGFLVMERAKSLWISAPFGEVDILRNKAFYIRP